MELWTLTILLTTLHQLIIPVTTELSKCTRALDVAFVMDSSGSLQLDNWDKMKEFVNNFIDSFKVDPATTRIGVEVFSGTADVPIKFDSYKTIQELKSRLNLLPWRQGFTRTDVALTKAYGEFSRYSRGGKVAKVLFLIYDGLTDGPMLVDWYKILDPPAKLLRQSGVNIIVAGVGIPDIGEMQTMQPNIDYGLVYRSFDLLLADTENLKNLICKVPLYPVDPPPFPPMVIQPNPVPKPVPCKGKLDLAILLDSSPSAATADWESAKAFINYLLDNLDISPDVIRLGLITYSTTASIHLRLNNFMPKEHMKEMIAGLQLQTLHSRTDVALQTAKCHLMTSEDGARGNDVSKVIIVITDGKLEAPAVTTPNQRVDLNSLLLKVLGDLRCAGIQTLAVGMGNADPVKLGTLACNKQNVYKMEDKAAVVNWLLWLTKRACVGQSQPCKPLLVPPKPPIYYPPVPVKPVPVKPCVQPKPKPIPPPQLNTPCEWTPEGYDNSCKTQCVTCEIIVCEPGVPPYYLPKCGQAPIPVYPTCPVHVHPVAAATQWPAGANSVPTTTIPAQNPVPGGAVETLAPANVSPPLPNVVVPPGATTTPAQNPVPGGAVETLAPANVSPPLPNVVVPPGATTTPAQNPVPGGAVETLAPANVSPPLPVVVAPPGATQDQISKTSANVQAKVSTSGSSKNNAQASATTNIANASAQVGQTYQPPPPLSSAAASSSASSGTQTNQDATQAVIPQPSTQREPTGERARADYQVQSQLIPSLTQATIPIQEPQTEAAVPKAPQY